VRGPPSNALKCMSDIDKAPFDLISQNGEPNVDDVDELAKLVLQGNLSILAFQN